MSGPGSAVFASAGAAVEHHYIGPGRLTAGLGRVLRITLDRLRSGSGGMTHAAVLLRRENERARLALHGGAMRMRVLAGPPAA